MNKILLCLLLLVVGTTVLSQSFSPTWLPTESIEVMRFRQGVSPTAGYAGCVDSWMDAVNTTTNHGTDTTLILSGATELPIMNWDISALPDDAVIHSATLRILMISENVAVGADFTLFGIARIMRPWTESHVTWAARKDPVADSLWSGGGATDYDIPLTLFGAVGPTTVLYEWNQSFTEWTGRGTDGEVSQSWGLDSLYSAHGLTSLDASQVSNSPIFDADITGTHVDVPRWVHIDVTRWARMVHAGAWAAYGFKIEDLLDASVDLTFKSSESVVPLQRPELVIEYLYAAEEVSGGGGSGRGNLGFEPIR